MTLKSAVISFALVVATACGKEGNPVALPTDPGAGGTALVLSVSTDQSQLVAGSTAPATITISAMKSDGTPAPAGSTVNVSTTLGSFGSDSTGKPIQLTTVSLVSGRGSVQFFAGSTAGTASILVSVGTVVATLNLPIGTAPASPVADFTFVPSGLTVIFTDASMGSPTGYSWDFGDGQSSTSRNPTHTYAAAATYQVTLTVTNLGGSSAKSQFVPVSLGNPPMAAFDFTVAGNQVNFVDASVGATSWSWNFGDGTHDNVRNPIHTYPSAGTYTVTLAAANAAGSSTANKVVTIAAGVAPVAAFTFTVTGNQVNFVDTSANSPTVWLWSFGDGTTTTQRNPIHVYPVTGAYTVTLQASNSAGSNSASQVVVIAPPQAPKSAFTFKTNGLQANFADASTGNPTSWSWTFGDSTTSTQQNPVHTYAAFGNYTVVLTVTNTAGSNSSTQIVTLTAPPAPVASFTATANASNKQVNFVDTSTGGPTSWFWSFGDGLTSSQQNPIHTYTNAGTYTVTLTAANSSGSSKATQAVTTPAP